MATEETTTLLLEIACYQNYKTLLGKLHQARLQSGGKTQTQDLVRTFMLGVKAFFPCSIVRVYFAGWHFEHFEHQGSFELPPLSIAPQTLAGFVFQEKIPFLWQASMGCPFPEKGLDIYQTQGVTYLHIFPLLDVNQNSLGVVEISSCSPSIPLYQQELLDLVVQQLGVLLETGQQSVSKGSLKKPPPSREILARLWRNKEEIENTRERERLFASMILYFRDNLRMADAWRHLESLTPQNEVDKYDFKRYSAFYFQKAYHFSNLLLYGHKITHQTLKNDLENHDLLALIHKSISEFSRYHPNTLLRVKTQFPSESIHADVDCSLFHIAIVYTLEHFFLQTRNSRDISCLAIILKNFTNHVLVEMQIEKGIPTKQLKLSKIEPDEPADLSLKEYGLENLFIPFVKTAILHQGGSFAMETHENQIQSVCLEILKTSQSMTQNPSNIAHKSETMI